MWEVTANISSFDRSPPDGFETPKHAHRPLARRASRPFFCPPSLVGLPLPLLGAAATQASERCAGPVRGRERHVACRALTEHRRPARPFCHSESPCAGCQSIARMPSPSPPRCSSCSRPSARAAGTGAWYRRWGKVKRVHPHSCHGSTHSRLSLCAPTPRRRIASMASLTLVHSSAA